MSRRVGYSTWFQYSRVHLFYRKITLDFSLVKCRKNINKKIMNHKCDHALKVLLPEQKVKRNHNQTIKTLLLIEDLFSSAGKIGIPVKWIAFWSYVSGVNWEVMNHQWACFPTQTFRVSDACKKAKQALTIQCDSKLEICKKGTKGLHKKMETVMAGCCVEVQCTFSHFKWQRHWFKCYAFNSTKWHARGPNFHALIYLFGFFFFFFQSQVTLIMYIAPCVKRRKRWAKFWCSTMQCSIWDHAKCIHFTGIYSMLSIKTGWEVHNDIQLI